jgi:hypothetical protein
MEKNTKILIGCAMVIGGLVAYNKGDNEINIKANDTIGTKTLGFVVMAIGGWVLYKSIK